MKEKKIEVLARAWAMLDKDGNFLRDRHGRYMIYSRQKSAIWGRRVGEYVTRVCMIRKVWVREKDLGQP
jgi:hypothetical protein